MSRLDDGRSTEGDIGSLLIPGEAGDPGDDTLRAVSFCFSKVAILLRTSMLPADFCPGTRLEAVRGQPFYSSFRRKTTAAD